MDDEISVQDILARIWARRGLVASFLVLALLACGAGTVFWLFRAAQGEVLYYVDLNGVEKGRYPGGATFSPNDLQSREVLRAAIAAAGAEGSGAQVERVARAILVEHGSPDSHGIVLKYKSRLAAVQPSLAEMDAITAEFRDELALASMGSLRIMLNLSAAGLDDKLATRVVQEIPAQWSRLYSERYRIYQDPGLESFAVSLKVEDLDRPAAIIAARAALRTLHSGLRIMASDNRINHLVSSSGTSAAELLDRLIQFEDIDFRPLSESVMTQRDPVADSYRFELRRRIRLLEVNRDSYDRITEELGGHEPVQPPGGEGGDAASPVNQLQLSGDALRRIIALAEQASSASFLREMMLKRHAIVTEIAEIEAELAYLDTPSTFVPPEGFASAVTAELNRLLREYVELHDVGREALRAKLGRLYSASSAPYVTGRPRPRQALVPVAGIMAAVLGVSLLTALLLPHPEEKRLVRA